MKESAEGVEERSEGAVSEQKEASREHRRVDKRSARQSAKTIQIKIERNFQTH